MGVGAGAAPAPFTQLPPMLASCVTIAHHQTRDLALVQ